MNFVIFSICFLPDNGAESYCTARFASALARAGHRVRVVTIESPQKVSSDVYDFLVDSRIEISRIKVRLVNRPLVSRLWYRTYEWDAVNYGAYIRALKKVLKETEKPILISRANPLASMVIGWHCRKYAWKWISHASDPIPIPGRDPKNTLHGYANRYWMRKSLKDADFISVTCPNAIRAFHDEYGDLAKKTKFVVVPHIGEPLLPQTANENTPMSVSGAAKSIVHRGVICAGRGGPELAGAVRELNHEGLRCRFVQCGQVDDIEEIFQQDDLVVCAKSAEVDVEYIPDLNVPLPYCPFLSSKIVYRLFENRPIVLFSNSDSLSAQLARQYPKAGIFFADNMRPETLRVAIRAALDVNPQTFDRTEVRNLFSQKTIVDNFLRVLE